MLAYEENASQKEVKNDHHDKNVLNYCPIPSRLPFVKKIVCKIWSEDAVDKKHILLPAIMSLSSVTGKRAEPLFAQEGDASKKIREGMPLGARVELTGRRMYEFLDKVITTVLPRIREWEGIVI